MEMHIVFASTVKHTIYKKAFEIHHVISHLDTNLRTYHILGTL